MLNNLISTNIVKPTNVEAQRILNILDELVKDIEILSYIDVDFLTTFLEASSPKGLKEKLEKLTINTLDLLKNQAKIENNFHEITKPAEEDKDVKEKKENEDEEENNEEVKEEQKEDEEERKRAEEKKQQEIVKCRDELIENLKNLLRMIRTNNNDYNIIKV